MEAAKNLVEMKGVVKKFPGVTALNNISFNIRSGEVHVLLGENGAGKSTLMKILSGVYQPTQGSIVIDGKEFSRLTPKESTENGISVIYQELSVINELSIQENLFIGKLPMKKLVRGEALLLSQPLITSRSEKREQIILLNSLQTAETSRLLRVRQETLQARQEKKALQTLSKRRRELTL